MKSTNHAVLFICSLLSIFGAANSLKIPFSKRATPSHAPKFNFLAVNPSNGTDDLTTVHDIIYIGNITVGGVEYPVQMDTGSSDLWIKSGSTPSPGVNATNLKANLSYGLGWAAGQISTAPVRFAGFNIPEQAFVDATSVDNPALGYGAKGIVGLGFTSMSSVDLTVNTTRNESWGRSLLYNAFSANPNTPNFMAFSLQRGSDPGDNVEGSFTIGEFEPLYKDVQNTDAIPTFPPQYPKRWNVLLDGISTPNSFLTVSTNVSGAPSNRAVMLLDTGSSYAYGPADAVDQIYSSVSGARFDTNLGQWIVPCNAEIDIALQISGRVFPIHPLDVVVNSLTIPNTCVGSFVPSQLSIGAGQFDWLVGVNVLRSIYTVYDFGDFDASGRMGDPYIKLMSLISPDDASADFTAMRGGTPRKGITYNVSNSTANAAASTVSVSDTLARSLDRLATFIPAMLGILALNAVALITVAVVGICWLRKRRNDARSDSPGRRGGLFNRRRQNRGAAPSELRLDATTDADLNDMRDRTMSVADSTFSMGSPSTHMYAPVALRDSNNNINVRQSLNSNLLRDSVVFPLLDETGNQQPRSPGPYAPPRPSFARSTSHLRNQSTMSALSPIRKESGDAVADSPARPHSVAFSAVPSNTSSPIQPHALPSPLNPTLVPLSDASPAPSAALAPDHPATAKTESVYSRSLTASPPRSPSPSPTRSRVPSRASSVPVPGSVGAEDNDFVSESPRRQSFQRTVSGDSMTLERPKVGPPARAPPPIPTEAQYVPRPSIAVSPPPRSALRPRPEFQSPSQGMERPHSMAIPQHPHPPSPLSPQSASSRHSNRPVHAPIQQPRRLNSKDSLDAPRPPFAREGSDGASNFSRPFSTAY